MSRNEVRDCVLTALEVALIERLTYPPATPSSVSSGNETEVEFARRIANVLESTSYEASKPFKTDVKEAHDGRRQIWNIVESDQKSENDRVTFMPYLGMIAQFLIHISPAFYTGRHSFYFRDLIVSDDIDEEVVDIDVEGLWPEFFGNDFLSPKNHQKVLVMRKVELQIAMRGLLKLFSECCSSETKTCSASQRADSILNGGIFKEKSPFSFSRQIVCFGSGRGESIPGANKIILPCDPVSSICPKIPEDKKQIDSEIDSSYFQSCLLYEDFLAEFAESNFVLDPTGEFQYIDVRIGQKIRENYGAEIQMMAKYLNLTFKDDKDDKDEVGV